MAACAVQVQAQQVQGQATAQDKAVASLGIQSVAYQQPGEPVVMDNFGSFEGRLQNLERRTYNGVTTLPSSYYFQYESVFLTPHVDRNTAFTLYVDDPGAFVADDFAQNFEFPWSAKHSPRIEFGYLATANELGWRARYWIFHHSTSISVTDAEAFYGGDATVSVTVIDDPSVQVDDEDSIIASQSLSAQVIDLEALAQRQRGLISAGLRYVRYDSRFVAAENPTDADPMVSVNLDFEGFGPTMGTEVRHRLGQSNFTMFANARGSLLFGDRHFDATETDDPDTYLANSGAELLGIGEMQVGLEWTRGNLFLRAALEGQYWLNAGVASAAQIGNDEDLGDTLDNDLGFFGGTIGGGVRW